MRSEEQYLTDIVEAADAIARFLAGIEPEGFLQDELRQSAVRQFQDLNHPIVLTGLMRDT